MRVNRRPLSQEKLNVKTRKNRGCSWLLEDLQIRASAQVVNFKVYNFEMRIKVRYTFGNRVNVYKKKDTKQVYHHTVSASVCSL